EYRQDARKRRDAGKLKPNENVSGEGDQVQVSGQVVVMEINARLVRRIFEANPEREFYIEESFPLDWMFPFLVPHGPILKLERQPVKRMAPEILTDDREYWD